MSRDTSPDLLDIQRRFHDAVLGREDTALASVLRTDQSSVAARIAIYRGTVQRSLIDTLSTAFPVTRRLIGDVAFAALGTGFIATAPPRVPQLSAYGDTFATFIAGSEIAERLPYLSDTARLEWARTEAYFAADAPALDPLRLTQLAPARLERTVLALHPATRIVSSAFPIFRIWEANQPDVADVPRVDMTQGQAVLVTRPGVRLITVVLGPGDAAFVAAVRAERTLGEAADAGLAAEPAFELQAALQRHFINHTFQDTAPS